MDVYIEPVLPKPRLIIFGRSPVARYLATLADAMNFSVAVLAEGANRDDFPKADIIYGSFERSAYPSAAKSYVVVSTQGESDEDALEALFEQMPDISRLSRAA